MIDGIIMLRWGSNLLRQSERGIRHVLGNKIIIIQKYKQWPGPDTTNVMLRCGQPTAHWGGEETGETGWDGLQLCKPTKHFTKHFRVSV